jgi:hypothetical protein
MGKAGQHRRKTGVIRRGFLRNVERRRNAAAAQRSRRIRIAQIDDIRDQIGAGLSIRSPSGSEMARSQRYLRPRPIGGGEIDLEVA